MYRAKCIIVICTSLTDAEFIVCVCVGNNDWYLRSILNQLGIRQIGPTVGTNKYRTYGTVPPPGSKIDTISSADVGATESILATQCAAGISSYADAAAGRNSYANAASGQ
jgi:hypothetical protein